MPMIPIKPTRSIVTAALALAVATALAPLAAHAQDRAQPKLPTVTLQAGMHRIVAEVARTPEQQAIGMMFRTQMGASEGMLFVNEDSGVRCFWMRNTLIPLSIAFLDDDGRIANIAEMQPRSERSHCSERPVRHALEMPKGWFTERGIGPGFQLRGPPFKAGPPR